jgi:hypothetical protein
MSRWARRLWLVFPVSLLLPSVTTVLGRVIAEHTGESAADEALFLQRGIPLTLQTTPQTPAIGVNMAVTDALYDDLRPVLDHVGCTLMVVANTQTDEFADDELLESNFSIVRSRVGTVQRWTTGLPYLTLAIRGTPKPYQAAYHKEY